MSISTPHLAPLPCVLTEGKEIIVEGTINHDARRVTCSLCKGRDLSDDTPMTYDLRFNDNVVVRSTYHNCWGPEERHGGFPFKRGEFCALKFVGRFDAYQVFVNNVFHCDYKHRMEKEAARNLFIEGDFKITKISFPGSDYPAGGVNPPAPSYQQGGAYPAAPSYPGGGAYPQGQSYPQGQGYPATYDSGPFINPSAQNPNMYPGGGSYPAATSYPAGGAYPGAPSYPPGGAYPGAPSNPPGGAYPGAPSYPTTPNYPSGSGGGAISNPPLPLTTPIPGGLNPGKIIYICGVPNNNPSRFTVNVMSGASDSAPIGCHFDARFKFGSCSNVVVRNHRENGCWGPEETQQSNFPFSPGANFEIMILTEQNCFKIAVNNNHFCEFRHRIQPIQKMDHINISGDVRITQVRFQ